jgi:hypothetical protein
LRNGRHLLFDIAGIVGLNVAFKLLFTPALSALGPYGLVITPEISEYVGARIHSQPLALIWPPVSYSPNGVLWSPTGLLPLYLCYRALSPMAVYLLVSSALVVVAMWCASRTYPSRVFALSTGLMLALGTQLSYALTMGVVLALYVMLIYVAIHMCAVVSCVRTERCSLAQQVWFVAALVVCALSHEFWIDYAVALVVALTFLGAWARRHGRRDLVRRAMWMAAATGLVAALYTAAHWRAAHMLVKPGSEEEIVLTYSSPVLAVDDMVTNGITLLYMSLSNYLPAVPFYSASATYVGQDTILTGQNGYHQAKTALVFESHLFAWRFLAGALAAAFLVAGVGWIKSAWRSRSPQDLVLPIFFLMIAAGSSIHLPIKMRPYNSTPMLGYKAAFATFIWTLLLAYGSAVSAGWFSTRRRWRAAVAAGWIVVFLAAMTRPTAINAGLRDVGLAGYGDPVAQILGWVHRLHR